MTDNTRLTIALQKKGRLYRESMELLQAIGVKIHINDDTLLARAENMALDLMLVRDDDIPTLVMEGVCDMGIIGENVLQEAALARNRTAQKTSYEVLKPLGFGQCRLSIASPENSDVTGAVSLDGGRIATTYPELTQQFLQDNQINCEVEELAGSVEIAPKMGLADAICDLVSTGKTLEDNGLTEIATVLGSQAVLIGSDWPLSEGRQAVRDLILRRLHGAIAARDSKYIMLHTPKDKLEDVKQLLPGSETPTVMALEGNDRKVAVHMVSQEGVFWDTLENLQQAGASSILVLPIEKMLS